jgi:hypothetical protein
MANGLSSFQKDGLLITKEDTMLVKNFSNYKKERSFWQKHWVLLHSLEAIGFFLSLFAILGFLFILSCVFKG